MTRAAVQVLMLYTTFPVRTAGCRLVRSLQQHQNPGCTEVSLLLCSNNRDVVQLGSI